MSMLNLTFKISNIHVWGFKKIKVCQMTCQNFLTYFVTFNSNYIFDYTLYVRPTDTGIISNIFGIISYWKFFFISMHSKFCIWNSFQYIWNTITIQYSKCFVYLKPDRSNLGMNSFSFKYYCKIVIIQLF